MKNGNFNRAGGGVAPLHITPLGTRFRTAGGSLRYAVLKLLSFSSIDISPILSKNFFGSAWFV